MRWGGWVCNHARHVTRHGSCDWSELGAELGGFQGDQQAVFNGRKRAEVAADIQ